MWETFSRHFPSQKFCFIDTRLQFMAKKGFERKAIGKGLFVRVFEGIQAAQMSEKISGVPSKITQSIFCHTINQTTIG